MQKKRGGWLLVVVLAWGAAGAADSPYVQKQVTPDPEPLCAKRAQGKGLTGKRAEAFKKECVTRIKKTNEMAQRVFDCKNKVMQWNDEDKKNFEACAKAGEKAGKTGKDMEDHQGACKSQVDRNKFTGVDKNLKACEDSGGLSSTPPEPPAEAASSSAALSASE